MYLFLLMDFSTVAEYTEQIKSSSLEIYENITFIEYFGLQTMTIEILFCCYPLVVTKALEEKQIDLLLSMYHFIHQ